MLYIVSGLFVVLLVLCFTSLASHVFTPTMSQLLLVRESLSINSGAIHGIFLLTSMQIMKVLVSVPFPGGKGVGFSVLRIGSNFRFSQTAVFTTILQNAK